MSHPPMSGPQHPITLASKDTPPFLVTGVPRSGTSACADALNDHPEILCAFERFNWPLEMAVYPFTLDDLFDPSIPDDTFFDSIHYLSNRKRHIAAYGNKKPRYYLTLHHLLSRQATKIIFVHRPPAPTAASWSVRALDASDTGWDRGMTGMYAYMDYVQMLHVLRMLPPETDYVVVDYNALFIDEGKAAVLRGLYRYLDVPSVDSALRAFMDRQNKACAKLKAKKRRLHSFETDYHDKYRLNELEDLFRTRKMLTARELLPHLEAFLDRLATTDFLDAFFNALPMYDHQPAVDHGAHYMMELYANAGSRSIFHAFPSSIQQEHHRIAVNAAHNYCDARSRPSPLAAKLLPHAKACIANTPSCPAPYIYLGDLLVCTKRIEEAVMVYKKGLGLMGGDSYGRSRIVRVLNRLEHDLENL